MSNQKYGNHQTDIIAQIVYVIMVSEKRLEEERLRFSDEANFFPEQAFQYLKTYSESKVLESKPKKGFFDFTSDPVHFQYSSISSFKQGFIETDVLLEFLNDMSTNITQKELQNIIMRYNKGIKSQLDYQIFTQFIFPNNLLARQTIQKRKLIYQFKDQKVTLLQVIKQDLARIFFFQMQLLRLTEDKQKQLIDDPSWNPIDAFELIDSNKKKFLDFDAIHRLVKSINQTFVPMEYLSLLRHLGKSQTEDTISFSQFQELCTPRLQYKTQNPNRISKMLPMPPERPPENNPYRNSYFNPTNQSRITEKRSYNPYQGQMQNQGMNSFNGSTSNLQFNNPFPEDSYMNMTGITNGGFNGARSSQMVHPGLAPPLIDNSQRFINNDPGRNSNMRLNKQLITGYERNLQLNSDLDPIDKAPSQIIFKDPQGRLIQQHIPAENSRSERLGNVVDIINNNRHVNQSDPNYYKVIPDQMYNFASLSQRPPDNTSHQKVLDSAKRIGEKLRDKYNPEQQKGTGDQKIFGPNEPLPYHHRQYLQKFQ